MNTHELVQAYRDEGLPLVCHYCGKEFDAANRPTKDHLTPKAEKGGKERANLVLACYHCNQARGLAYQRGIERQHADMMFFILTKLAANPGSKASASPGPSPRRAWPRSSPRRSPRPTAGPTRAATAAAGPPGYARRCSPKKELPQPQPKNRAGRAFFMANEWMRQWVLRNCRFAQSKQELGLEQTIINKEREKQNLEKQLTSQQSKAGDLGPALLPLEKKKQMADNVKLQTEKAELAKKKSTEQKKNILPLDQKPVQPALGDEPIPV